MRHRNGFTLVELSIVLVILGLLVGGVLTGQSLIHAAELRSISTQYSGYVTAANTFRDKYMAIPGDMTNATAYWGPAAAGAACKTTIGTGTQTCNGDGDGKLSDDVNPNSDEPFRFWQHLANAGMVEGSYTGVKDGSNDGSASSKNSPKAKLGTGLWKPMDWMTLSGGASGWLFDGNYNNSLNLGAYQAEAGPVAMLLKPEDVYNVDAKMDDGRPATGKVGPMSALIGVDPNHCTNAANGSSMDANYNLQNQAIVCALMFRNVF